MYEIKTALGLVVARVDTLSPFDIAAKMHEIADPVWRGDVFVDLRCGNTGIYCTPSAPDFPHALCFTIEHTALVTEVDE